MTNGKSNDIRIDLYNILYIIYPESKVGFIIPQDQEKFTDKDWINKYPEAESIYKIYGQSPYSYVTKNKIK